VAVIPVLNTLQFELAKLSLKSTSYYPPFTLAQVSVVASPAPVRM